MLIIWNLHSLNYLNDNWWRYGIIENTKEITKDTKLRKNKNKINLSRRLIFMIFARQYWNTIGTTEVNISTKFKYIYLLTFKFLTHRLNK